MFIEADDRRLQYCGRIDYDDPKAPQMVYPCSFVKVRFTGNYIRAVVSNKNSYWENYLGYFIDGKQDKIFLPNEGKVTLTLGKNLGDGEHEVMLFKRQDSCHLLNFYGFEVEDGSQITAPEPLPERRIEVYGDSVSAGEVAEAVGYVGQPDPAGHRGQFSNSWYSYSWLTARKLGAQIHDIAQGGISLLDGIGWFAGPDFIGMESCYDKIQYYTNLGPSKQWDFNNYHPQVVIVAVGQNDANPEDFMAKDYNGPQAIHWRKRYMDFLKKLRELYPNATIITATTILGHDEAWDRAIDEACIMLDDPKVHHFLYSKNGCGTKGHIRIPEAEKMAEELSEFIEGLGAEIWMEARN